ncbi:hypothetical protein FHX06_007141 [Rhizobium sp. BK512]|nr:hypothetical protein [Rhizobium sp. BK512]
MEDKDWDRKWAQDAESLINLMPTYQMNPDQMGPIVRNTADGRKQLVHARWGLPSPFFVIKEAAEAPAKKLREKGKPVGEGFGRNRTLVDVGPGIHHEGNFHLRESLDDVRAQAVVHPRIDDCEIRRVHR